MLSVGRVRSDLSISDRDRSLPPSLSLSLLLLFRPSPGYPPLRGSVNRIQLSATLTEWPNYGIKMQLGFWLYCHHCCIIHAGEESSPTNRVRERATNQAERKWGKFFRANSTLARFLQLLSLKMKIRELFLRLSRSVGFRVFVGVIRRSGHPGRNSFRTFAFDVIRVLCILNFSRSSRKNPRFITFQSKYRWK